MVTVNGYIKKAHLNASSAIRSIGITSIDLVPGDELKWVRLCGDDDLVALVSQNGMLVVNTCKLRPLGTYTKCACAMRLKEGDKMVAMDVLVKLKEIGAWEEG